MIELLDDIVEQFGWKIYSLYEVTQWKKPTEKKERDARGVSEDLYKRVLKKSNRPTPKLPMQENGMEFLF